MMELPDWLDQYAVGNVLWYAKRLSGNDTLANDSHQAGPYVPKNIIFSVVPSIDRRDIKNPDSWLDFYIDSHSDHVRARAVYYNNKYHGSMAKSPRDEARFTNFGGIESVLLNPESTGAISVFVFRRDDEGVAIDCHVWVCRTELEEEIVEDRLGPIEPGRYRVWTPGTVRDGDLFVQIAPRASCWLSDDEMPTDWLAKFPSGLEIVEKAVALRPDNGLSPDNRMLRRRDCEFEIFRSVEQAIELPNITAGFSSVDEFIVRAQTILQRRKARSGRSLELHARAIFIEEQLVENTHFSHQPVSEPGKSPDFLFPSQEAYQDNSFPADQLRMLAVKTTCRDRWRQILNEADRIPRKHLLTLQEGVSENQFREMTSAGVTLVVPEKLREKFPKPVRPHLQNLESFIGDVRSLAART
ncbi:type II restriction endonuclease [Citromicrobium sp. JLT1363]|uniref:type II restriction endonuclease n=1 Tax=Citromicrobium sp. JLT1363 TaxID=517722 RepID=UPI00192B2FAB|nr:type II restriction endonuclease [Citromicrobium sp. JLT1363]